MVQETSDVFGLGNVNLNTSMLPVRISLVRLVGMFS